MAKERKKHTEEFKRDAVRMMRNRGQRTVAQVADNLGVNANQLHRWASLFERRCVRPSSSFLGPRRTTTRSMMLATERQATPSS